MKTGEPTAPPSNYPWLLLCAVPVLLPTIYLASFYVLLERKLYFPTGVDPATGQNLFDIGPQYRIAGIEPAMRPAYWLDRRLRSDFWTTVEHSSGRGWKTP